MTARTISFLFFFGVTLVSSAFADDKTAAQNGTDNPALSSKDKKMTKNTLSLNSLELSRDLISVSIDNDSDQPMNIIGVQSTANLFVESFDKTVAPGKSGEILVNYDSQSGFAGPIEFLRVKTNLGLRQVAVNISRPVTVTVSASELFWNVGDPVTPKSIAVSIGNRLSVLSSVQAVGVNTSAVLTDLGSGQYRVDVSPGSTASANKFPVLLKFTPVVPGAPQVIICTVK